MDRILFIKLGDARQNLIKKPDIVTFRLGYGQTVFTNQPSGQRRDLSQTAVNNFGRARLDYLNVFIGHIFISIRICLKPFLIFFCRDGNLLPFSSPQSGNKHARLTLYAPEDFEKYGFADPDLPPMEKFTENHNAWVLTYNNEHGIMDWLTSQKK